MNCIRHALMLLLLRRHGELIEQYVAAAAAGSNARSRMCKILANALFLVRSERVHAMQGLLSSANDAFKFDQPKDSLLSTRGKIV